MPLAKPLFPIVFITSLLSFTAAADEIKLKNGDIITGTIIKKKPKHKVLFGLIDIGNTLVFSRTGLRVPVGKNLNASTQINLDYNNQPAVNRKKLDKTLLFSLGYGW